jgi:hypothetical protein
MLDSKTTADPSLGVYDCAVDLIGSQVHEPSGQL